MDRLKDGRGMPGGPRKIDGPSFLPFRVKKSDLLAPILHPCVQYKPRAGLQTQTSQPIRTPFPGTSHRRNTMGTSFPPSVNKETHPISAKNIREFAVGV